MQVYKTFFKIAQKKLSAVLIYFFVFMILTIIMSNTAQEDAEKFQISSVNIWIHDMDQSAASQALSDYLTGMHKLVELDSYDNETLQDNLYYQRISYALIIPEGFEEELLSGSKDALVQTSKQPNNASGYFVDQQVDTYLNALSLYLSGGFSLEDAVISTREQLSSSDEVTSVSFDKKTSGGTVKMYYFFQYLPYALIMILLEGLSPILMAFHRKDLENRIICSSLPANRRNIQIGLGCATYSLGIWILFLLIAVIMYGPQDVFSTNGLLCILNSLIYILILTAISLFISTFSMNTNVLSMVANVLGLGMSFLCGIFVPQWFLGDTVVTFSRFLPAYWHIRIVNMLSGFSDEAFSMNTYWTCIAVQLLFLLAIFSAYLAASRQRKKMSPT